MTNMSVQRSSRRTTRVLVVVVVALLCACGLLAEVVNGASAVSVRARHDHRTAQLEQPLARRLRSDRSTTPQPTTTTPPPPTVVVEGDVFGPLLIGILSGLVVVFGGAWWQKWSRSKLATRVAVAVALFTCVHILTLALTSPTSSVLTASRGPAETAAERASRPVEQFEIEAEPIATPTEEDTDDAVKSTPTLTPPLPPASAPVPVAVDGRTRIAVDTSDAEYVETYFSIPPSNRTEPIAYTHEAASDDLEAQLRAAYPPVGDEEGPALRPACQKETDILQRHIHSIQYPQNCKTARILLRRWWYQYGYFAGLNTDVFHLHHAQVTGRLYMDLTENTYLMDVCPTKGLSCVFRALTNCTAADFKEEEVCYDKSCMATARVISFDRLTKTARVPCTTAPDDAQSWCDGAPAITNMNEIGRAIGLRRHGHQFFRTEFVRFMYRPNELLFNYTVGLMRKHQLSKDMISVHVRHGDFINGGLQYPTIAYAHVLRRLVEVSGLTTIFIGSDDDRVYEELPALMEKEFQGHPGTPKLSFRHIPREEAGVLYDATDKGAEKYGRLGLALSAQLLLFGLSEVFLGTRVSQQGILVQDVHPLECGRQKIYFDMGANIWFDGLYFSSRLQNKHAGREWMCSITPGEEGPDQLIYQWKGATNTQPRGCGWCAGVWP